MSCGICQKKSDMPHTCSYCGGTFCDEHSLPENHNCYIMSIKNWDTHQKYEIAKGNISTLPKEFKIIKEAFQDGWVNIKDYDPNPEAVDTSKVDTKEKDKKYICYQGRWLTFEEYGALWKPLEEKKEEPKFKYKKPNFLKKLFK